MTWSLVQLAENFAYYNKQLYLFRSLETSIIHKPLRYTYWSQPTISKFGPFFVKFTSCRSDWATGQPAAWAQQRRGMGLWQH